MVAMRRPECSGGQGDELAGVWQLSPEQLAGLLEIREEQRLADLERSELLGTKLLAEISTSHDAQQTER